MSRISAHLVSDRTVMAAIVLNSAALSIHEMAEPGSAALPLANVVIVDEMIKDNTIELERKVDALNGEIRSLRQERGR